ncbi:reverse transcriptase domain-containing protein [Tanacetum coccineum]
MEPVSKKRYREGTSSRGTEVVSKSEDSGGGLWKSKSSIEEDDLSQSWVCEETNPFTPRIHYFDLPKKTQMLSNVKTYDESDDPEDHLKIFQATVKVERWAILTWCHMFNSTLTGSARVWFDDLPPESVDSYDDLKKAFLANFLQPNKCIKDPIEIHHIKQREGESTEYLVQRFKTESRHIKGAQSVRKKALPAWKQQEAGRKFIFDRRGDFRNQQRSERRRDNFTLLTKSLKEILALDKGKFKTPPPMTTPELKQSSGKDQLKATKKGEASRKDKSMTILMALFESEKPNASSHRNPHWFQQRNHMANETNNAASKIVLRGILTLRSSKIILLGCTMVSGLEAQPSDITRVAEERIKVAIHLEFPEQTIEIGSTLTEEGRKETPTELSRRMSASKAKEKKPSTREKQGNTKRSREACRRQHHEGSPLPQLVIKSGNGGHVPGIQSKYQGDKSLPEQGRSRLRQMKKLIAELPTLTVPAEKEELIVYLAAAREVASAVLMTEREAKQMPIYFISRSLQGIEFTYALRFRFDAINNEAEYEALIACLRIAEQMGVKLLQTHVDFCLVANQINGSYIATEPVEECKEKSKIEAEVLKAVEEEGNT